MPTEKQRTKKYYVTICTTCGKEFEVPKDSSRDICDRCEDKQRMEKATKWLAFLIGAKITSVTPCDSSYFDHIIEIRIETAEGKEMVITAEGWTDNRYMVVEDFEEWDTGESDTEGE